MSKMCPLTNTPVVYLDCQECDDRDECKRGAFKMAADNTIYLAVGNTPRERAELIQKTDDGIYPGKTSDGKVCVITMTRGESMKVKVNSPIGFSCTTYDSTGEAVSYIENY